ncbi:MAG: glycoside hydrolase family 32 protein [Anaerolineae bacterium]
MPAFRFSDLPAEDYLARAAEARRLLANDPQRPRYHFTAPANWLNDPNGLIQWHGLYHMFYQHIPDDPAEGAKWWGHAVSRDLVHWQDRPLALAPTPGSADADGIWSGCCLAHKGRVYALYTGFKLIQSVRGQDSDQRPCLAWANDDSLDTWTKYERNPFISQPSQVLSSDFRDHTAWRAGGWWYQGIGSSINHEHGAVQLYRSHNLLDWEYRGRLLEGDPGQTGWMWECPSFFNLDNRHVLITSPIPFGRAVYFSGHYEEERFYPDQQGEVDTGGCFYAPQTFLTEGGRRVMFGWLWEGLPARYARTAGWAGAMSLPRVLTLDESGSLCQNPAAEVSKLRGTHWEGTAQKLLADHELALPVNGTQLELDLACRINSAGKAGALVRCSPDGAERTVVGYDASQQELYVDCIRSSRNPDAAHGRYAAPMPLRPGEALHLHIFLDASVLEVFANGRTALACRIYPQRDDSTGLALYAGGGDVTVTNLNVWEMQPIW